MPMERLVAIFFAILGIADYLPISIAVIMDIRLLGGIEIGVTVISGRIIGPTRCRDGFATYSYHVLACGLNGGKEEG